MKRYLLDSGTASDFVNARGATRAKVKEAARAGHHIGLGTPIPGELIGGVLAGNDPARHLRRLRQEVAPLRLWPFDGGAANEYGKLFAELRAAGRLMQVPDMQLAAIARFLGNSVVVTKDSDLVQCPGWRSKTGQCRRYLSGPTTLRAVPTEFCTPWVPAVAAAAATQ